MSVTLSLLSPVILSARPITFIHVRAKVNSVLPVNPLCPVGVSTSNGQHIHCIFYNRRPYYYLIVIDNQSEQTSIVQNKVVERCYGFTANDILLFCKYNSYFKSTLEVECEYIIRIPRSFQFLIVIVSALPSEHRDGFRDKRDVMESMKNAWSEVVKTLSDAGDAVVHVFKPTEKSVVDKMTDGIKSITG